ncbi:MAG: hypothetical protein ACYTGN_00640 [Planctomycetota bacterium]
MTASAQDQVPLPVKRSSILRKGGVTYFVEGRQKIPRGCEISVQKDVFIVGRGKSAVLEVEGSLQIHGVLTREVIVKDLWIEPSARFEDIHLDMVKFRDSGGLRAPKQLKAKGKVFVENVIFGQGTFLELALAGGRVDLSALGMYEPAVVVGLPEQGKIFAPLTVNVRGCTRVEAPNGFVGGLFVKGAKDVTVRINYLGGAKSEFSDCYAITFDGNKVMSAELAFSQSASGRMSKTKLQKSDIYSTRVSFKVPPGEKEGVRLDKCWFKGIVKKKEILEKVIRAEGEVIVKFGKINKRPLELAGPLER